jgi:hypothetical protein
MINDLLPKIIAIDELLCSPDAPGQHAAERAALPVGLLDQYDAATKAGFNQEARRALVSPGTTTRDGSFAELPGWIRLGVSEALVRSVTRDGITCEHVAAVQGPAPVVAAASSPGAFTCRGCLPLLFPAAGTEADRACDRCGHIAAGALDDGLRLNSVCIGPVTFYFCICSSCHAEYVGGAS